MARFLAVSRDGAWEQWLVFVLNAVAEQAIDAYECAVELQSLRTSYHDRFPNRPAVRDVVDYVFEAPSTIVGLSATEEVLSALVRIGTSNVIR